MPIVVARSGDVLKLLFCCENYPPSVGGVQEVIRQIAERLAIAGHDVTVATSAHSSRPADTVRNGVRVLSFPITGNWVRGMHGPLDEYMQFVIQGGFDAVCIKAAQQWTFDALVEVLPSIPSRKIFIPCGFSALYQRHFKRYFAQMPRWLRSVDALVFYASEYRDIQFVQRHGLRQIFVIPNGADEREFDGGKEEVFRDAHSIGYDDLLFLTVGSMTGLKGHWEVARAFELAKFSGPATLVLNGNTPQRSIGGKVKQFVTNIMRGRSSLSAMAARINAQQGERKRVILCDLPRAQLVAAFKASDLFVLASYVEYSPLVLFEAVAAGTAFLSSPAGNAKEIAEWTQGGEIFPCPACSDGFLSPEPEVLARHLEAITVDRSHLREIGQCGRSSFVSNGYSWAKISLQYEAILTGSPKQLPYL